MKTVSNMNVCVWLCMLVVGMSLGDEPAMGVSASSLPRVFQKARLGMGLSDLVRLQPGLEKSKRREAGAIILTSTPANRHLKRVAYRFHADMLYEITIHYRIERLPHGPVGLLAQLKEAYGPPTLDREEHFDREHGDISRWGTVWEDAQTRMTLLERQYLYEARLLTTLTLTLTDLELARQYDAAQEEQVRRKWRKVPIPMPEHTPASKPGTPSDAGR